MKKSNKSYSQLSDQEKRHILESLYLKDKKSFSDIAEIYDTYANRIRRDAKKFNIKIRNKSEAQKNALDTGKHSHPTKGTTRPNDIKEKIGLGVLDAWQKLDKAELDKRKLKAKKNWEELDDNTKEVILKAANSAVRATSKVGSKLEKYLQNKFLLDGYKVEFHKEQTLVNTKLQIDLFLPSINLAIEVDGPSHFAPVWGADSLNRNQKYDSKKEGLITGKGWNLLRVIQTKDFSEARSLIVYKKILDIITKNSTALKLGQQKFTIKDTDG